MVIAFIHLVAPKGAVWSCTSATLKLSGSTARRISLLRATAGLARRRAAASFRGNVCSGRGATLPRRYWFLPSEGKRSNMTAAMTRCVKVSI